MRHKKDILPILAVVATAAAAYVVNAQTTGTPPTAAVDPRPCKWLKLKPMPRRSSWISSDDYPPSYIRSSEQGDVTIDIVVGVDGRVSDVRVTSATVGTVLQEATKTLTMRRARFWPAMDNCVPVKGIFQTRVRWMLPES